MKGVLTLKTIKTKIIFSITIMCFLVSVTIGSVLIYREKSATEEAAKEKLLLTVEKQGLEYDKVLTEVETATAKLENVFLSNFNFKDYNNNKDGYVEEFNKRNENYVKTFAETTKGCLGIYFVMNPETFGKQQGVWYADLENSKSFIKQQLTDITQYDKSDMEHVGWYYEPIKAQKGLWMKPYFNKNINLYIISYVIPVYMDNQLLGVVGIDIKYDNLFGTVKEQRFYNTGYLAMLARDYDILSHPSLTSKDNIKNVDSGAYNSLVTLMDKQLSGTYESSYDDNNKIIAFRRLINDFIIYAFVDKSEIYNGVRQSMNIAIFIVVIALIVASIVALVIGKMLASPITKLSEDIKAVEHLNLRESTSLKVLDRSKDEIGIMNSSIRNMKDSLKGIIKSIMGVSKETSQEAINLSSAAEETSSSIQEVARAVEQLAHGEANQTENTKRCTEKMDNLEEKIKSVYEGSVVVQDNAKESIKLSEEGEKNIKNLVDRFSYATEANRLMGENIEDLSEKSKTVESILITINSITEQINLLALNAAIEAARAGEAGRGFSVVAEEVRKLAAESKSEATNIKEIINGIQGSITMVKSNMEKSKVIAYETNSSLEETRKVFGANALGAKKVLQETYKLLEEVSEALEDKEQVGEALNYINTVSMESSAATEQISAAIEQQAAMVSRVSNMANNLSKIAVVLEGEIEKFII
ncbi:methyl-accepting chemotaxis protein [Clostridium punense]|uniref:Methyl-accepting chemotaxis protein n=2 Tax=Clostridium TaxID=1485 RepID=A0ABS4K1G2_9CLOT|nr:methyl-accepting chemotaxis protein [Clostridium punense]MBP2021624.1 methyl-accepting chemotaxis protein [Clostridium punense]